MSEVDIDVLVDDAVNRLIAREEIDLSHLDLKAKRAVVDRVREKIAQLRLFAENGGLRSKPPDYVTQYSREVNALLGLAMRVNPSLVQLFGECLLEALDRDYGSNY